MKWFLACAWGFFAGLYALASAGVFPAKPLPFWMVAILLLLLAMKNLHQAIDEDRH